MDHSIQIAGLLGRIADDLRLIRRQMERLASYDVESKAEGRAEVTSKDCTYAYASAKDCEPCDGEACGL